jgi:2-keto-4-pentenoate hydratase/2-oxohepta-3-ene-1,7-dioic acid hydratase in catechol pathway
MPNDRGNDPDNDQGKGKQTMKLANVHNRPTLVVDDGIIDVADASLGRFGSFESIFSRWEDFCAWARGIDPVAIVPAPDAFGPAVPRPRQVIGVGFNYAAHVGEAAALVDGTTANMLPLVFAKLPTSITGPTGEIALPDNRTDYEVELVVAIGTRADQVAAADAWSHVAGLMVGQDISSRGVQFLKPEQHCVGKSFRTFSPLGPYLVTPDELPDPDNLMLRCWVNGELRQKASTREMIYGVAELIELLSAVTALEPGDLIFTGTPAGVGGLEDPPRYLAPGDVIASEIEGLGRMENRCVPARPAQGVGARWHTS